VPRLGSGRSSGVGVCGTGTVPCALALDWAAIPHTRSRCWQNGSPRRCGVVAAVVALVLLACLQIQYHHLKVDLGKAGFASATQDNSNRNRIHLGTSSKPATATTNSLPRGIVERHSDMYLRPLWDDSAATTHKNKNGDHNALLAMAVGISQIKNVDTMARKVCVSLKFPFPLSLSVCVAWERRERFI
jgi:hypothetical protein